MIEHGLDMESTNIDFLTFCHISSGFMTEEDEEGLEDREELTFINGKTEQWEIVAKINIWNDILNNYKQHA